MSGKGKMGGGALRVMKGIGGEMGICLLFMCMAAWLVQKGSMADALVYPLLAVSVFIASLIGSMIALHGVREKHRILSAVPGMTLALMILTGRWISGCGKQSAAFVALLTACAAAPALLAGVRRPQRKRR